MSSNAATITQSDQLDFEQVKQIIPQRFPFLMLDRVVEIEPGIRVVGLKNLTGNEWFYQGHFPKKAVTPGAMIIEAIAQTGIVFFHIAQPDHRDVTYLMGSLKIRFIEPVWPGDQLRIEVRPVKLTSTAVILSAEVRVEDRLVSKGEFALAAKANDLL
ncbi:MAG: 3-hydroxyacyl-ACP dehydratase FabZ [Candidatus Omnitrophota bacterium]|nr:3-hydroxyacyl-ACP dehydratase FabZ [Candidatus Omnitrophota bacterium]